MPLGKEPHITLEERVRDKPHVTKQDIKAGLHELGLRRGNDVGVHSSLSSFGYVEGGADAVIDALLETVGEEGTVVMPSYSTNRRLVELTEEEKALGVVRKEEWLPYDPKENPCWTGRICDTFWRRKNAVRGPNPTHSLAAIGPKAEQLCQGWGKVLEAEAFILLIGVSMARCSSMHQAERKVADLAQYLAKVQPPPALKELMDRYKAAGFEVKVAYPGILTYPQFGKMEEPSMRAGVLKTTKVGEATLKLARLKELIDLYADYLTKTPDMFYRAEKVSAS